jgi:acetoacetyl-CoA reductase
MEWPAWHELHWSPAEHAASVPPFPKAGYHVAATYVGNDAAAEAFRARTGASVYRWDAGDFEACAAGIRRVEASVGG